MSSDIPINGPQSPSPSIVPAKSNGLIKPYPLSILAVDVGVYLYILVHLFFYVGGLPPSYYAYQVFLDSLMFGFFLSLPIYWFTGSGSNPIWLILCLIPEILISYIGFSGYFPYLIPFFAQLPLLRLAIGRYYARPGKELVTAEEALKFRRRANVALYTLVALTATYILSVTFVFFRSRYVSVYTNGPNYTSHYTGIVFYFYPNLATFMGISVAFLVAGAVLGGLTFRYNRRAL